MQIFELKREGPTFPLRYPWNLPVSLVCKMYKTIREPQKCSEPRSPTLFKKKKGHFHNIFPKTHSKTTVDQKTWLSVYLRKPTLTAIISGAFVADRLLSGASAEAKSRRPQISRWSRRENSRDKMADKRGHGPDINREQSSSRDAINAPSVVGTLWGNSETAVQLDVNCSYYRCKQKKKNPKYSASYASVLHYYKRIS